MDLDPHDLFLTQSRYIEPAGGSVEHYEGWDLGMECNNTVSDEELSQYASVIEEQEASKGALSMPSLAKSTLSKCKWAAELFNSWKTESNRLAHMDSSISRINPCLADMTKDEICYSVSRFLTEVTKKTGEEFPPATLYELVISLQLYLESMGRTYKLLQDESYIQLRHTLDHLMKEGTEQGIVNINRKAEVITLDEEELLWRKGILGSFDGRHFVDTILYLLGLKYALRAGQEHRQLRWENRQLSIVTDTRGLRCLRYREDVSKGNQGGLKHRKVKRKVVYAYEDGSNTERCVVTLFRLYDQHCPKERKAFYLRPLEKPTGDMWFSTQPIGIHSLTGTIGRLCKQAGVGGFRSNHSLRATAATRLYEEETDEQIISEITGHRSSAVREYKRTNDAQRCNSNDIVCGRKSRKCSTKGEDDSFPPVNAKHNCKCTCQPVTVSNVFYTISTVLV